jgi:general secretion pathway protein G
MNRRSGFTLVELVVVILILGILAGVAAPKMFSTSAKATDNGLKQTLAVIRDGIEMYQAQNGALPAPADDAAFKTIIKPYVRGVFPKSPVNSGGTAGTVKIVSGATTTADGTTGWMYNTTTGEFICNSSTISPTDAVAYSTY